MEFADRGLMAPLTRQLGMVLRIVRQQQQQQQQQQEGGRGGGGGVWMLQGDKECVQLLGRASSFLVKGMCRFRLEEGGVLEVLGEDEQRG